MSNKINSKNHIIDKPTLTVVEDRANRDRCPICDVPVSKDAVEMEYKGNKVKVCSNHIGVE